MKPAPFEYHAPRTVAQLCELLERHPEEGKILAKASGTFFVTDAIEQSDRARI